jgi:hypothetical protein
MTDFYGRLEDQLVEAGRRRAAQRGRRHAALAGRGRALIARRGAGLVALAAALLAIAGVAGVAALRPGSSAAPAGRAPSAAPPVPPPVASRPAEPSLRGIAVTVLNATTTSGAARAVADLLEKRGATILAVRNALDQTRTQTTVEYLSGAEAKAHRVAQVLRVGAIRPRGGAHVGGEPEADVVIDVGADRRRP